MPVTYQGEHLLPGLMGQFFIYLSFASAIGAAMMYFISSRRKNKLPLRAGKAGNGLFLVHFLSLLFATGFLYFLIFSHYFEYQYVWQYSSRDLPFSFIFSCFWAGQEGSFLIWALFQALLGMVVLLWGQKLKYPVLFTISLAQVFLVSMVLGLQLPGLKIGSSPFLLIRNAAENVNLDFFRNPDYLSYIKDGNGLNPLLMNVWMVIHPPVLFLGYAAALVPLGYFTGALWKKDFTGWIRPVLPWVVFSVLSLGVGIIFGGAWAYRALTFGGFWAWDPVENASLVPWLTLVAALHCLLIGKRQKLAFSLSFIMVFISYALVVYASYLTRSGVLGETSAHAFGDEGRSLQLLVCFLVFLIYPLVLFIVRYRHFPKSRKENTWSREFWMVVGSLVVILSAFQIIVTTSIPVLNKVFGTEIAPPNDRVGYYNNWQTPFAIAVALLIGLVQYLNYGTGRPAGYFRKILRPAAGALVLTAVIAPFMEPYRWMHTLFLFFLLFGLISSLEFYFRRLAGKKNHGAIISHTGLLLFLAGVLFAFSQSRVISNSASGSDQGGLNKTAENQMLLKDKLLQMGKYTVIYRDHKISGKTIRYQIDFFENNGSGKGRFGFSVYPSVLINERMGNVYEPDTKHLTFKDIYTYLSYADLSVFTPGGAVTQQESREMRLHDSINIFGNLFVLDTVVVQNRDDAMNEVSLKVIGRWTERNGNTSLVFPAFSMKNDQVTYDDGTIAGTNYRIRFERVSEKPEAIVLDFYTLKEDFIVVKSIIFPFINVLWIGALLMFAGLVVSLWRRVSNSKTAQPPDEEPGEAESLPEKV